MQAIKGNFEYEEKAYIYSGNIPDAVVFSYSNHIYVRLKIKQENNNPAKAFGVILTIDGPSQISEKRYTNAEGDVIFDISRIIQMMTDNRDKELTNLNYNMNRLSWLASTIRLRISVNYELVFIDTTIEAINGTISPEEQWFIRPVSLKYWRGLPHTFDFLNVDSVDISIDGSSFSPMSWIPGTSTLRYVQMMRSMTEQFTAGAKNNVKIRANGLGVAFEAITPAINQVNIEIDSFCGDMSRYTYLRWLGRQGEVFYWLFKNGTQTTSVKSEKYSIAMTEDVRENYTYLNGIKKEPTRELTRSIASEYVSRELYQVLSSVIASPCVDMYLGNHNGEDIWKRVDVADGSTSEDMKRKGGKVYSVVLEVKIGE